jgi:NADPH:quinone reductase-like Zn-dependent oxidoreductase
LDLLLLIVTARNGVWLVQYVDVPMPKPKKGEILVKVEAASVNPVDWRIQDGLAKHILPRKFPYVPGA